MSSHRVYIGSGLSYNIGATELRSFFQNCGTLIKVHIFNGYAIVEFATRHEANLAVDSLNGKMLSGKRVTVRHARAEGRQGHWVDENGMIRTDYRLRVLNLPSDVKFWDLKDNFRRRCQGVVFADAHRYPAEGFVEFDTYSSMKNAIQRMSGCTVQNQALSMVEDTTDRYGRQSSSHSHSNNRAQPSVSNLDSLDPPPAVTSRIPPAVAPPMPPAVAPPMPPAVAHPMPPAVAHLMPPAVAPPIMKPVTMDKDLKSLFQKTWTDPDWNGHELPNENKVMIGSIPPTATVELLVRCFSGCSGLVEVRLIMIPQSDKNRGYGYMTFREREGAAAARKMDGVLKLLSFETQKSLSVDLYRPMQSLLILNIGVTIPSSELFKRYNKSGFLLKVLAERDPEISMRHGNRGFCVATLKSEDSAKKLKNEICKKWRQGSSVTVAKWADPNENEAEGEDGEMDTLPPPSESSLLAATNKVTLMEH